MENLRSRIVLATALAASLALGACATEDYVDQKVADVNGRVDATNANVAALSGRVDGVEETARHGVELANQANELAASKSAAKFNYTDLDQGISVMFATNKWSLSPADEDALKRFAERLKEDNKDVYIEIVGHGDARGSTGFNRVLGAKRALQVQRYLSDQGVALNRMNVVSWGEEKATNPKDRTPEGLQMNRRVDLIVKG